MGRTSTLQIAHATISSRSPSVERGTPSSEFGRRSSALICACLDELRSRRGQDRHGSATERFSGARTVDVVVAHAR
jgi:hypothetical protein